MTPPATTETKTTPQTTVSTSTLLTTVACVLFVILACRFFNYTEDDVFIHMRYGLNFWHVAGWVMNPGERVNGCTSPFQLWRVTLLLRVTDVDHALVIIKLAGMACGLMVLITTCRLAHILVPSA